LVEGEGFAVDASVIEANASRFQRVEGSEIEWTDEQRASRPVREYVAALTANTRRPSPSVSPKRCRLQTRRRPRPRAGVTR
jgi:hypothetical protein